MRFIETELAGCFVIDVEPVFDERGFFARTFCAREFEAHGLPGSFVQSSISTNALKGTLRGLHFEPAPHMEEKLVTCHAGAIFDVAVDIRPGSPTFSRWIGSELTADNHRALYLPKGFAHGFITLSPNSVVGYQMAQFHVPGRTLGIRWNDPHIGIDWPLEPILTSERDAALPTLAELKLKSRDTTVRGRYANGQS